MKKFFLSLVLGVFLLSNGVVFAADDPALGGGTSFNSAESRAAQEEFDDQDGVEGVSNELRNDFTDDSIRQLDAQTAKVEAETARVKEGAAALNAETMDFKAQEAERNGDVDLANTYREAAEAYREAAKTFGDVANDLEQRANDAASESKVSILPATDLTVAECQLRMNGVNINPAEAKTEFKARNDVYVRIILGCAIKVGDVKLWMLPYYVRFILEFLFQIGGLVAVGGIVYGGYYYMMGGILEEKERGKTAILYSLMGVALMMTAWAIVNILISALTG